MTVTEPGRENPCFVKIADWLLVFFFNFADLTGLPLNPSSNGLDHRKSRLGRPGLRPEVWVRVRTLMDSVVSEILEA